MKLTIYNEETSFQVKGEDFQSIARLLRLPPWAREAYEAWTHNSRGEDFTLHVAEGITVMVEYVPPTVSDPFADIPALLDSMREMQIYADYHKDFYGFRPLDIPSDPTELARLFDVISTRHAEREATPEGRTQP